jgi:2-dehydropantoate 2-reductase
MAEEKFRVLIVGTGGVGTMSAYALMQGGKADVTAVMRSNYDAAVKNGISIDSIQYGHDIKGFRPTHSKLSSTTISTKPRDRKSSPSTVVKAVPNVEKEGLKPFDFILVTTKNIPDVSPTVADIIEPAVTPGKTAIVLSQNGLNIEKPIIPRFPQTPIISSVSTVGATERAAADIFHDDDDAQKIGAFQNQSVPQETAEEAANTYINIYNPSGKLDVVYDADVQRARWRKLLYNGSFNPIATILRMDTRRMRQSRHIVDDLVLPIMFEVLAAARACGVTGLTDDLPGKVLLNDDMRFEFKPSMCQDIEKGNLFEMENIVGEPLREGEARGVAMPTLRTVYGLLKGLQLQGKERKGLWEPRFTEDNPYK